MPAVSWNLIRKLYGCQIQPKTSRENNTTYLILSWNKPRPSSFESCKQFHDHIMVLGFRRTKYNWHPEKGILPPSYRLWKDQMSLTEHTRKMLLINNKSSVKTSFRRKKEKKHPNTHETFKQWKTIWGSRTRDRPLGLGPTKIGIVSACQHALLGWKEQASYRPQFQTNINVK